VLAQVQQALAAQGRVALSGLGGVGKTQTAVEYAHRHLDKYDHVFWATADSQEALISGYVAIAGLLKLPESDAQDQTLAVGAVKRWLASSQRWLLLLDNADRPEILEPFLPSEPKGHILLTSRAQLFDTIDIVKPVDVDEMSYAEARNFLFKRTGREEGGGPEPKAASQLTAELGFLPLALEQACAYIVRNKSLFQDYLHSFRKRRLQLLNKHGPVAGGYRESVRTTWSMNFRELEKESGAAADLLRLCAFLSPDSIPIEFLTMGAPALGNLISAALANVQEDPVVLDETLAPLTYFSLIRRQIDTRSYSLHRLVQEVVSAELNPKRRRLWAERAVRALELAFPDTHFSTWSVCERFLPQVHACANLIDQWAFGFLEAGQLLQRAGVYLSERGRYVDAEPLFERARTIREKALGPDDPDVAWSLYNLGVVYHAQGRYANAEPLFERARATWEKALGSEHPDVAFSLHALALLYDTQGQYAKAEPLYKRALAIREKGLGPEHPNVAWSLQGLAGLYHSQGQYGKAEPLYQRALAIRQRKLQCDHPNIASSLHNLAELYYKQGRYEKAALFYEWALEIWEKALGPEHPDVALNLHNLARLYDTQAQYAKAEPLYVRALEIREKALGADHPDVASSLQGLAGLYHSQGQYEKAEPLYERALTIRQTKLQSAHPDMAWSLQGLAGLYHSQGQYGKAEPLYERAAAMWTKALGPEHPNVALSLHNLARLYDTQAQYTKAEPLYKRACLIWEKALGPENQYLKASLEDYALLLRAIGRPAEAEPLEARAMIIPAKRG
jgi:tetratricopeptide (TPR) repeat protein